MNRHRSVRDSVAVLVGAVLALLSVGSDALAISACRWDNFNGMTIDIDAAAMIERSGDNILVDGATCDDSAGTATVSSVQVIHVQDNSSGGRWITISLAGGPFAPGLETGPSPDLWFDLQIGGNQCDVLRILGSTGVDTIRWGRTGHVEFLNLNADETADIDFDVRAVGSFHCLRGRFLGSDGPDVVSGAGGLGTDLAASYPLKLLGGAGSDHLTGGNSKDWLLGELGNDALTGGLSADVLNGGDGADRLKGGEGPDVIKGGNGRDVLIGGPLVDVLDGGPGFDTCSGGSANDELISCEKVL